METNAGEVKKTLTLIQQENEEAEMFVGNNTRERNGKERIETMLWEHLQKLDKEVSERMPSQATALLDTEPKKKDQEAPEANKVGQSINHTEEIDGRQYQEMPEMDARRSWE